MSEELGKIEKPSVDNFTKSRKLIVAPLLFSGKDAPPEFVEIYSRCWNEVTLQINKLEDRLGSVSTAYHEMIFLTGDEGMKMLEQLNPDSYKLIQSKIENGAELQSTEDPELALENVDWERCLMVAMGPKVRTKVMEYHTESSLKRYEFVAKNISETLSEFGIGLLFVREGHRTQFPQDIEVFNVYPPALDELNRWLREYSQKAGAPPAA